jgi:membrane protease YdiL (CAAX protease family)
MSASMRSLSPRSEFVVVTALAFGTPVYSSLVALTSTSASHGSSAVFSDASLWALVAYEVVVTSALVIFLSLRGWTIRDIGFTPSIRDTALGIPLLLGAYSAYYALWYAFAAVGGTAQEMPSEMLTHGLSINTVISASCVNGLFEEVFVCGYVISALKQKRSAMFAVNVSVAIRATYHLYQGTIGVLSIIPLGLVFGHWFVRTGRLWPVVVAHVLADIIALMYYVR